MKLVDFVYIYPMLKTAILSLIVSILIGCQHTHYKDPHIIIETSYGEIELELYPARARATVTAFLAYIDSGYFKNSSIYRLVRTEDLNGNGFGLIQGGISQTNEKLYNSIPGIKHESTKKTGLSHTSGTISLARLAPGTASTEFFICVGDQTQFDEGGGSGDNLGFSAFGKVVTGMEIVRKIHSLPSRGENFEGKHLIENIKRL